MASGRLVAGACVHRGRPVLRRAGVRRRLTGLVDRGHHRADPADLSVYPEIKYARFNRLRRFDN